MKYDVEFCYVDDDAEEWPVFAERFDTLEEAEAFAAGLTWGDEPRFYVVRIVTVMMP